MFQTLKFTCVLSMLAHPTICFQVVKLGGLMRPKAIECRSHGYASVVLKLSRSKLYTKAPLKMLMKASLPIYQLKRPLQLR